MKHAFTLLSMAAVAAIVRHKTENRLNANSIHRRGPLGALLPSSNPFAGGVTGMLLVLCLWLEPVVLEVNAASG